MSPFASSVEETETDNHQKRWHTAAMSCQQWVSGSCRATCHWKLTRVALTHATLVFARATIHAPRPAPVTLHTPSTGLFIDWEWACAQSYDVRGAYKWRPRAVGTDAHSFFSQTWFVTSLGHWDCISSRETDLRICFNQEKRKKEKKRGITFLVVRTTTRRKKEENDWRNGRFGEEKTSNNHRLSSFCVICQDKLLLPEIGIFQTSVIFQKEKKSKLLNNLKWT